MRGFRAYPAGYLRFARKLVCVVVKGHFREEYRRYGHYEHKDDHHYHHENRDADVSAAFVGFEPFYSLFHFVPPLKRKQGAEGVKHRSAENHNI